MLRLMKNTSILINTARGGLGDEVAHRSAARGPVSGVALDVFEEEPLSQDSSLRSLENVDLPPHNANAQYIRC